MNKTQAKNELQVFADTLKENGFTVLVSKKHPFEWLHFYKDGKFADVNPASFYGYNFGTTHKPCRQCGTGFGIAQEVELTIENANNSFSVPGWATNAQRAAINPYSSVEDFITHPNNKWAEYYIL